MIFFCQKKSLFSINSKRTKIKALEKRVTIPTKIQLMNAPQFTQQRSFLITSTAQPFQNIRINGVSEHMTSLDRNSIVFNLKKTAN